MDQQVKLGLKAHGYTVCNVGHFQELATEGAALEVPGCDIPHAYIAMVCEFWPVHPMLLRRHGTQVRPTVGKAACWLGCTVSCECAASHMEGGMHPWHSAVRCSCKDEHLGTLGTPWLLDAVAAKAQPSLAAVNSMRGRHHPTAAAGPRYR